MSELCEVRIGAQLGTNGKIANTRMMFSTGLGNALLPNGELGAIANAAATALIANVGDFTTAALSLTTTAQGVSTEVNTDYSAGPPEVGLPFKHVYDTMRVGNGNAVGNGTKAGTVLPPQNAVVVTLRTNLPGRVNRGRMYWFPPLESEVNEVGLLSGVNYVPVTEDIITAVEAVLIVGGSLQAVVASTRTGGWEPIVSVDQGTRIDTQRRRLPRTIR